MSDLLIDIGSFFKEVIESEGYDSDKLKGYNGPYNQEESNLRTICHLICLFSYLSNEYLEYKDITSRLVDHLLENYGNGEKLLFRTDPNTDSTNGVMGPAWFLESLYFCNRYGIDFDKTIINKVIVNHKWDESECGFCINLDDQIKFSRKIDKTFNHKLWFVATVSQFDALNDIEINRILDALLTFETYQDDIIYHKSSAPLTNFSIKKLARKILYYTKSVSYHPFNQVAARYLLNSDKLSEANRIKVESILTNRFYFYHLFIMMFNKYGAIYNPVGYEVPEKSNAIMYKFQDFLIRREFKKIKKSKSLNFSSLRLITRIYERSYDDFM